MNSFFNKNSCFINIEYVVIYKIKFLHFKNESYQLLKKNFKTKKLSYYNITNLVSYNNSKIKKNTEKNKEKQIKWL